MEEEQNTSKQTGSVVVIFSFNDTVVYIQYSKSRLKNGISIKYLRKEKGKKSQEKMKKKKQTELCICSTVYTR